MPKAYAQIADWGLGIFGIAQFYVFGQPGEDVQSGFGSQLLLNAPGITGMMNTDAVNHQHFKHFGVLKSIINTRIPKTADLAAVEFDFSAFDDISRQFALKRRAAAQRRQDQYHHQFSHFSPVFRLYILGIYNHEVMQIKAPGIILFCRRLNFGVWGIYCRRKFGLRD